MPLTYFKDDPQDTQACTIRKLLRVENALAGLNGKLVIADASAHTPASGKEAWVKLVAVGATVIASCTDGAADSAYTALALASGESIFGYFTSVTLTSGKLVAYYL